MPNPTRSSRQDELANLPRDEQAERVVLAAILLQSPSFEDLFDTLQPSDFYDSRHQVIFRHLRELNAEGKVPNLVNLYDHLTRG